MRQHTPPKDLNVPRRNRKIPDKIPLGKRLHEPASTIIPPYPLLPVHLLALLIVPDQIQRKDADDGTLEQRDDVYIPVDARALVEVGIGARAQQGR